MIKEIALMQAESELNNGIKALNIGNVGKARVCARRACFAIIDFWLKDHSEHNWGNNAMSVLESLKDQVSFPFEVREAAKRLTSKVDQSFSTRFAENPIDDAKIIIQYFSSHDK
jgi:hypothetical protein